MLSIISLLVVLTLSILVTRIATVALTYTGLSKQSARFQARSAFTGVGFTTSESEKVVNHPMRRRILLLLMLLGNAGVITAVSSLIVSFVNVDGSASLFWQVALLVAGLIVLWSLANSSWVDRHLSNLIAKGLKHYTVLYAHDFPKLLHLAGDYQINELHIEKHSWLAGKTIGHAAINKEGVLILGINRANGNYLGAPDGNTKIEPDDTLIVYGRADVVEEMEKRDSGTDGTREHRRKIVDQQQVRREEKRKDSAHEEEPDI